MIEKYKIKVTGFPTIGIDFFLKRYTFNDHYNKHMETLFPIDAELWIIDDESLIHFDTCAVTTSFIDSLFFTYEILEQI